MLVIVWLVLLFIACATLHQTLSRRLPPILGGMFGIILFIVVALGALNLEVVSNGAIAYQQSSEVLSFVGLGGFVVNLVWLFAAFAGSLPTSAPSDRGDIS